MVLTRIYSIIRNYWITGLFAILFLLFGVQKLAFYVRFDFNFILLILVLPFVLKKQSLKKSLRYGFIAIGLFLLYPFFKLSSLYFLAFVCSFFFLFESRFGKLSSIPLFLILIVSPVAIFLSEVVGFEIRLWITAVAAKILSLINAGYSSVGNIILLSGKEFHVDPECMGLKMVLMSLFVTLLFISFQQQRNRKEFHMIAIIGSLLLAYLFVIVSNLSRIVLITLLNAAPGSISHELIGMVCFVVYVVIPIWMVVKKMPFKPEKVYNEEVETNFKPFPTNIMLGIILLFLVLFRFTSIDKKESTVINQSTINLNLDGFNCTQEEHGVLKISNTDFLMYIKPAVGFYSAEHTPIICWKGSGYKVQKEQIVEVGSMKVYYSELLFDNNTLYSTWWYDSGKDKTISQFGWRTNNLISGDKYYLVNVVASNRDKLMTQTTEFLKKELIIGK